MEFWNVDLIINNRPIDKYMDRDANTFVEGRKGSDYSIQISHKHSHRVKAVVSVDGINVVSGDQNWDKGYVIEANSQLVIPGWRINENTVSAFKFADTGSSYAARSDNTTSNCGVIGVMFFIEDRTSLYWNQVSEPFIPTGQILRSMNWPSHEATASLSSDQELGIAWGTQKQFDTTKSYAKFLSSPSETIVIYYDDAKGLAKRGIYVRQPKTTPTAFPGYSTDGCKPPR